MGKEITIYDIARELGLSATTVSRGLKNDTVISKATTKKITEKAAEMGYRYNNFAGNLGKQKTQTIGIIVHRLNSNFIASVLAGIENITIGAGYDIIITNSCESYEKEVANAKNLFHKRVDGIIASLSFSSKNLDHFKPFFERNIPVVFFDRVDEKCERTQVIIDNYKCGYIATKHLLDQGCQRIVLLTSSLNRNVYSQRHRGYSDALFDSAIEYDKKLILIKDISEEGALEAAREIIKMNPLPDGLFVTNDFEAAVCMQELKRFGVRVPDDIAIVGFNNDTICKIVDPQLTTINYPGKDMGEITARTLITQLNRLESTRTTNRIIVNSELIIRESSIKKK